MSAGMHQIEAQVARTPDQRIDRLDVPQGNADPYEGMLFVFEQPSGLVLLDEKHTHPADCSLHQQTMAPL